MIRNVLNASKNILAAFGGVWIVYNAAARAIESLKPTLDHYYSWALALAFFSSVSYSLYTSRRLKSVDLLTLGNGNKLKVSFGDLRELFSSRTSVNFVIPVNDYFDTELGDVISPRSVHGQFLEWCYENHNQRSLDRLLNSELDAHLSDNSPGKRAGKTARYEMDAKICIHLAQNYFYLLPTSQMQPETLKTNMLWTSYPETIDRVCKFLRDRGNGRDCLLPLIGDRMSRSGLPPIGLLQQLVLSIWRSDKTESIGGSIEIVLFQAERKRFDLRGLKKWSENVGLS